MKQGRPGRLVNLFGQNSFKQILLVSFLPLGLPLYQLYFRKQVKKTVSGEISLGMWLMLDDRIIRSLGSRSTVQHT